MCNLSNFYDITFADRPPARIYQDATARAIVRGEFDTHCFTPGTVTNVEHVQTCTLNGAPTELSRIPVDWQSWLPAVWYIHGIIGRNLMVNGTETVEVDGYMQSDNEPDAWRIVEANLPDAHWYVMEAEATPAPGARHLIHR